MAASTSPLPMPIHFVTDHARMRILGHVAYCAVLCISTRYWLGECRPLPDQSADRMAVARISAPGWVRHESTIEAALSEILPLLLRAREDRLADLEDRRARAARSFARRKLDGTEPYRSPHHTTRKARRDNIASPAAAAAAAAMDAAGIGNRRLGPAETAETAIAMEASLARPRVSRPDASRPDGSTGMADAAQPPEAKPRKPGLIDASPRRTK